MQPILGRWASSIYEFVRIVAGILFAFEGASKLFGGAGASEVGFTRFRAAGILELGCGILVVLGLFTSLAAFVAALEMGVAYLWLHLPVVTPVLSRGKLAALYCIIFLLIATRGAGRFSLDSSLWPTQKGA